MIPPRRDFPHVDIPVGAAGRHHAAVGRPGAVEKVLLEVMSVALEHLDTSLTDTERTDILKSKLLNLFFSRSVGSSPAAFVKEYIKII